MSALPEKPLSMDFNATAEGVLDGIDLKDTPLSAWGPALAERLAPQKHRLLNRWSVILEDTVDILDTAQKNNTRNIVHLAEPADHKPLTQEKYLGTCYIGAAPHDDADFERFFIILPIASSEHQQLCGWKRRPKNEEKAWRSTPTDAMTLRPGHLYVLDSHRLHGTRWKDQENMDGFRKTIHALLALKGVVDQIYVTEPPLDEEAAILGRQENNKNGEIFPEAEWFAWRIQVERLKERLPISAQEKLSAAGLLPSSLFQALFSGEAPLDAKIKEERRAWLKDLDRAWRQAFEHQIEAYETYPMARVLNPSWEELTLGQQREWRRQQHNIQSYRDEAGVFPALWESLPETVRQQWDALCEDVRHPIMPQREALLALIEGELEAIKQMMIEERASYVVIAEASKRPTWKEAMECMQKWLENRLPTLAQNIKESEKAIQENTSAFKETPDPRLSLTDLNRGHKLKKMRAAAFTNRGDD